VMTRQVQTIAAKMPLADAMARYFGHGQAHRAFPVVDEGVLKGVVDRETIAKHAAQNPSALVGDALGATAPPHAVLGDNCRSVASRLARLHLERLPVVKDEASLELVGIIARSDLIKPAVIHFEEEEKRERLLGLPWRSEP
jgi:CBS domain-containing protein